MYNYEFAPSEMPKQTSSIAAGNAAVSSASNSAAQINRKNSFSIGDRKFVTLSNGTAHHHHSQSHHHHHHTHHHNSNHHSHHPQQQTLKYITSSFGSLTPRNLVHHQQQPQSQQVAQQPTTTTTIRRPAQAVFSASPCIRKSGENGTKSSINGVAATSSTSSDAESFLLTDLEYDEVKMYKKSGVGASRVERNLLTGGSLSKKSLNGIVVDKKFFRSPVSVISCESLASIQPMISKRVSSSRLNLRERRDSCERNQNNSPAGLHSNSLYNKQENKVQFLRYILELLFEHSYCPLKALKVCSNNNR